MDLLERIGAHFQESAQLKLDAAELLAGPLAEAVDLIVGSLLSNGKILACGVGGSAADAQHFASKLVGRFERERPELAAIALGTDGAVVTASGNDHAFDEVFAKQIRAFGQAGDVLLAIATSGNSPSVLNAVQAAHDRDMRVVALTGRGGGRMAEQLRGDDVHICVPHERTARIQEVHILAIHCLCDGIDCMLMGEEA